MEPEPDDSPEVQVLGVEILDSGVLLLCCVVPVCVMAPRFAWAVRWRRDSSAARGTGRTGSHGQTVDRVTDSPGWRLTARDGRPNLRTPGALPSRHRHRVEFTGTSDGRVCLETTSVSIPGNGNWRLASQAAKRFA